MLQNTTDLTVPSEAPGHATQPERLDVSWLLVLAICLVGFLLRLLPILLFPSVNHPDEVFQTLEQAHRIIFGTGVVPWEFQLGARSYILPLAIAGLMRLSQLIGDGPEYYLPLVHAAFAALSTTSIVLVYLWSKRFCGTAGALASAAVMALSVDAIYFGPRTSPEVVSAHLFLIGCYAVEPGYPIRAKWRLFLAGLVFGLASLLRIQIALPVAAFMLWSCSRAWRKRLPPMLLGAAAGACSIGFVDWMTLDFPFASLWRYIDFNVFQGAQLDFGVTPWYHYLGYFPYYWGAGAAIFLFLGIIGSYYLPMLGLAGLLVVLEHSFIGHKEYRFIYLAVLCGTVLTGIGMGRVVVSIAGETRLARIAASCAAVVFWMVFSVGEAFSWGYGSAWSFNRDELRAGLKVRSLPSVCGVGLFNIRWWFSGGYTYMHFKGPMYASGTQAQLEKDMAGFNTLIYRGDLPANSGFRETQCFHDVCVATRAGSCEQLPTTLTPFIPKRLKNATSGGAPQ